MENFDLNSILSEFTNVDAKPSVIKKLTGKNEIRQELEKRREIMIATKDLLKSPAWKLVMQPKLINALKAGFGQVLRATPQNTTETALWAIISQMKANLSIVADLKYNLEEGERAARKLAKK